MSLIKKSNELVIPTTVKMMIYGQAGMGKSTVALSAPKPLLLDFDNGVKRMNMAHLENIDTVQVTSWSDVQQVIFIRLTPLSKSNNNGFGALNATVDFPIPAWP